MPVWGLFLIVLRVADQLFSIWSRMRKVRSFADLAELLQCIREAWSSEDKRPEFLFFADTLDFVGFLDPFMPSELHGHHKPLLIEIFRDDKTQQVVFKYKPDCRSAQLLGEGGKPDGAPLIALKQRPPGQPKMMRGSLPITPDVREGVTKCFKYILPEQQAWLEQVMSGKLGIRILDSELRPGMIGFPAEVTVGSRTEKFRIIAGDMPDGMFDLDWVTSGRQASKAAGEPAALPAPASEVAPMIVSNEALTRTKRARPKESAGD
jgi:hypothetical protein